MWLQLFEAHVELEGQPNNGNFWSSLHCICHCSLENNISSYICRQGRIDVIF